MVTEDTYAKAGGVSQVDRTDATPTVLAMEDALLQAPVNVQDVWMDDDLGAALFLTGTPSRYSKAFR